MRLKDDGCVVIKGILSFVLGRFHPRWVVCYAISLPPIPERYASICVCIM